MRRFTNFMKVLGITIIVVACILPAMAQDAAGECAPEELAASITDRLAAASGDREALMEELRVITSDIAANDAACSGLAFQGEDDTVLGPLSIPEGIYTYEATESSFMSVELTILDGDCGEGNRMSDSIFIGDATAGSQGVFTSAGCELLIAVTSIDPWELAFEKLR